MKPLSRNSYQLRNIHNENCNQYYFGNSCNHISWISKTDDCTSKVPVTIVQLYNDVQINIVQVTEKLSIQKILEITWKNTHLAWNLDYTVANKYNTLAQLSENYYFFLLLSIFLGIQDDTQWILKWNDVMTLFHTQWL